MSLALRVIDGCSDDVAELAGMVAHIVEQERAEAEAERLEAERLERKRHALAIAALPPRYGPPRRQGFRVDSAIAIGVVSAAAAFAFGWFLFAIFAPVLS